MVLINDVTFQCTRKKQCAITIVTFEFLKKLRYLFIHNKRTLREMLMWDNTEKMSVPYRIELQFLRKTKIQENDDVFLIYIIGVVVFHDKTKER